MSVVHGNVRYGPFDAIVGSGRAEAGEQFIYVNGSELDAFLSFLSDLTGDDERNGYGPVIYYGRQVVHLEEMDGSKLPAFCDSGSRYRQMIEKVF